MHSPCIAGAGEGERGEGRGEDVARDAVKASPWLHHCHLQHFVSVTGERGGRGAGALTMGGDYYSLIGGLLDDLDRKRVEVRRAPPLNPHPKPPPRPASQQPPGSGGLRIDV